MNYLLVGMTVVAVVLGTLFIHTSILLQEKPVRVVLVCQNSAGVELPVYLDFPLLPDAYPNRLVLCPKLVDTIQFPPTEVGKTSTTILEIDRLLNIKQIN